MAVLAIRDMGVQACWFRTSGSPDFSVAWFLHEFEVRILKTAAPALTNVLRDPEARLRAIAAETLGYIGADTPDVVAALVNARDDKDPEVKIAANNALNRIDEMRTEREAHRKKN